MPVRIKRKTSETIRPATSGRKTISAFLGVSKKNNSWVVMVEGKYMGSCRDEIEAAFAYDQFLMEKYPTRFRPVWAGAYGRMVSSKLRLNFS
jgi:hypothetical protein